LFALLGFAFVGCPTAPPQPSNESILNDGSTQDTTKDTTKEPTRDASSEPPQEPTTERNEPLSEPTSIERPSPEPPSPERDAAPDRAPDDTPDATEPLPEQPPESITCQTGARRPCFPVQPNTYPTGRCQPGRQTCQPDGTWGACQGATGPQNETCNAQDDDCDGLIDEGLVGCVGTLAGNGTKGNQNGWGSQASFASPSALAVGLKGHVYVADTENHLIRKINTQTGQVTTFAGNGKEALTNGPALQASFSKPGALAFDRQGNLLVADTVNHAIRKIDTQGNVTTLAGGNGPGLRNGSFSQARFYFPSGIVVATDGTIFVSDTLNHCIRKIDTQGNTSIFAGSGQNGYQNGPATVAQFHMPIALAIDSQNQLYVADSLNNMIRKIDTQGNVSTLAGEGVRGYRDGPKHIARFYLSPGVGTGPNDTVYVADASNQRIREVDTQGNVSTLAGHGTPGTQNGPIKQALFFGPTAVVVSVNHIMYIADFNSHSIRTIRLK
jgi:sugar lactone lactonase YvrE